MGELPFDLTWGEEKSYSHFFFTPRPPTRIGLSVQVFQRARGSPDQAYPDKYRQSVKDQGKTYTAHASTLPFKDNLHRSQIPACASTLSCTFDQFRAS